MNHSIILERDTVLALRGNPPAEDDRLISAVFMESPQQISAAYCPFERLRQEDEDDKYDDSSDDDDFEFALVTTDPDIGLSVAADDIFSDGRILPVYPFFNRNLLAVDRASAAEEGKDVTLRRLLAEDRDVQSGSDSSSLEPDGFEGLPAGTYCVWSPRCPQLSQELSRRTRSSSTGSCSSRRWHLRDLVANRCHSDGKEKFVFLGSAPPEKEKRSSGQKVSPMVSPQATAAAAAKEGEKAKSVRNPKVGRATEMDMVTAYRLYYGKSSGGQGVGGGRRSYLPYRHQLLVGFFAHGKWHSRSHHPSSS